MPFAHLADESPVAGVVVCKVLTRRIDARVAVEVELDERDAIRLHEGINGAQKIFPRVIAREVKVELAAEPPEVFRVSADDFGLSRGVLRLDPEAEFHPGRPHGVGQFSEPPAEPAVGKLLPVAARGGPVLRLAEPSGIDYEILKPQLFGLPDLLHHELEVQLVEAA